MSALMQIVGGFCFGVGFFVADILMVTITHHHLCG